MPNKRIKIFKVSSNQIHFNLNNDIPFLLLKLTKIFEILLLIDWTAQSSNYTGALKIFIYTIFTMICQ